MAKRAKRAGAGERIERPPVVKLATVDGGGRIAVPVEWPELDKRSYWVCPECGSNFSKTGTWCRAMVDCRCSCELVRLPDKLTPKRRAKK